MMHLILQWRFKLAEVILLLVVGILLLYGNNIAKASEINVDLLRNTVNATSLSESSCLVFCENGTTSDSFDLLGMPLCVQDLDAEVSSSFLGQIMACYCSPDKCSITLSLQADADHDIETTKTMWTEESSTKGKILCAVLFVCTSAEFIKMPDDEDQLPLQQYADEGDSILTANCNITAEDSHNLYKFGQDFENSILLCWGSQYFAHAKIFSVGLLQFSHSYGGQPSRIDQTNQVEASSSLAQAPALEPPKPDHMSASWKSIAIECMDFAIIVVLGLLLKYLLRFLTVHIPEINTPDSSPATSLWSSPDLEAGLHNLSESSSSTLNSPGTPSWLADSKGALKLREQVSSSAEQEPLLSGSPFTAGRFTISQGEIEEEEQPILVRYHSMLFQSIRQPAGYNAQEDSEIEEGNDEAEVESEVAEGVQDDSDIEDGHAEQSQVAEGSAVLVSNVLQESEIEEAGVDNDHSEESENHSDAVNNAEEESEITEEVSDN